MNFYKINADKFKFSSPCLYSVKWQSSGSPPSAFQVPYDSFRKQRDPTVSNGAHDINSSVDVVEDVKLKELDYDFICFFLTNQRLDLYRSIDCRCEDMLTGKLCLSIQVLYSSFCIT